MRKLAPLIILFILSVDVDAVHECGSPHKEHSSIGQAKHGCDDLKETDFFYGDSRGDSPELSARGVYQVGVRTLQVVNPNQPDILSYSETEPNPLYDRELTLEVWYPSKLSENQRIRNKLQHTMMYLDTDQRIQIDQIYPSTLVGEPREMPK